MELDAQDVAALLAEVETFSLQRVMAASERPEIILTDQLLGALSDEAAGLGLIPGTDGPSGLALWENCDQQAGMAFNIGLLTQVAYANAGIAFAWHRAALARAVTGALQHQVRLGSVLGMTMLSTGHYGLAQSALGRLLAQQATPEDEGVLADWLDHDSHRCVLFAAESWETLVWPIWQAGRIGWQVLARDQLIVQACAAQHGLDELRGYLVGLTSRKDVASGLLAAPATALYERFLKLDMMGLLAIAVGAGQRSATYARQYAGIRRQGGKFIAQHPAVQQMLGEIEMALGQAKAMLQQLARPVDELSLGAVAGVRGLVQASLCQAANQSVQVHGGIGYMRDAGPEKIVRTQNMLRLQAGGLREVPLLLAALQGGQA